MVYSHLQRGKVNVLTSQADWAWPAVIEGLFRPAGINLITARHRDQFVDTLRRQTVHAVIIDEDLDRLGLSTVRVIRIDFPNLPCLLLCSEADKQLLADALQMDVFSVLNKPLDIPMLRRQLDRLFLRAYRSTLFDCVDQ